MWLRLHRYRKRLMVLTAAMPVLQMNGCADPVALAVDFTASVGSQIATGVVIAAAQTFVQFLLQKFPGADLLQALLGGNAGFFTI